MFVLGIDAGGSKTVACLADDDGTHRRRRAGRRRQPAGAGELDVEKVLHDVIEQALGDHAIAAGRGLRRHGRHGSARTTSADARRSCGASGSARQTLVVNDALDRAGGRRRRRAGRRARRRAPARSPTASTPSGVAARAGGWGYVDRRRGLRLLDRPAGAGGGGARGRRRGPPTPLTPLVLAHFGIERVDGLVAADLRRGRCAAHVDCRARPIVGAAPRRGRRRGRARSCATRGRRADAGGRVGGRRGWACAASAFPTVLSGRLFRLLPPLADDGGRAAWPRWRRAATVSRADRGAGAGRGAAGAGRSRAAVPRPGVRRAGDDGLRRDCEAYPCRRGAGDARSPARADRRCVAAIPRGARPADRATPLADVRRLVRLTRGGRVDWSRRAARSTSTSSSASAPDDPGSYRAFMRRAAVRRTSTDRAAQHRLPRGARGRSRRRVRPLRSARSRAPAASTCWCSGSARTATSASTSRPTRWWRTPTSPTLLPETRAANAALFGGDVAAVPRARCRWGWRRSCSARRIVLLATGTSKAAAVRGDGGGAGDHAAAGVVAAGASARSRR